MIAVFGIININPDKVDLAKEATDALIAETRKEPGNISYEYFHALGDPGRISVFEEWESQEAIDSHMASPHMAAFFGTAGDLEISGVAIDQYEVSEKKKMM